ncbi:MAG: class I SAM-dependent methyltransferase [Myxococcales bacterium]|nr:class I SAM-dependent methyltransferase [Myxococcales bacterium]
MPQADPTLQPDQLDAMMGDFTAWPKYIELLEANFPNSDPKSILDIGGGNGIVIDRLLARFPNAHGVLLDDAAHMIERNQPGERKDLVCGSALDLPQVVGGRRFDVITIIDLLHHLVGSSREQTKQNVRRFLDSLHDVLTPDGCVLVYELTFDGWWPGIEPGDVIYALTRLRAPMFAGLMRLLGANTAGVGVAFRSTEGWRRQFQDASFSIVDEASNWTSDFRPIHFLSLGIRQNADRIFVLRAESGA